MAANATDATTAGAPAATYDAIVVGAGMSGLYLLHKLRDELGLSVRVFEAGSGVGGTWYWNRYPGARFDSESYTYGYSFSPELLEEWQWSEHFAPQPETEAYINFVADKFDLRRDITFDTRITRASYDAQANQWAVESEDGRTVRAMYLVTALGPLSTPYFPPIPGREDFHGPVYHTALWPKDAVPLGDRRVGVIGTGATAVQFITEVAKDVGHLTVFQRTPNYCVPLRNRRITPEEQADIRRRYPEMFARCRETFGAFLHGFDERSALAVSPAERRALFDKLWAEPGFGFWLANFHDILSSPEANRIISDYVRDRIRERVNDPAIAEMLCPTDHGFGTRRVPLESGYYEVYNQPNVTLVDVRAAPIERITQTGIRTADADYPLDVVVFATGFDAVTGTINRIDIRGEDGVRLKDTWADGPHTYLGVGCVGFPNLFTCCGPHNAGNFCNVPRCIEQNVEWISDCIGYLREHGVQRIRVTPEAQEAWTEHVYDVVKDTLIAKTDSWFNGSNIPGKPRAFLAYAGGYPAFRERCDRVAANGYEGFVLEK